MPQRITIQGVAVDMRIGAGTGWRFAVVAGQEIGPFATDEELCRGIVQAFEQRHADSLTQPAA